MTLRRPAAHLRRPPSWRRSGDESYWESLMTEGDFLPQVSHQRARRPQSAIEGGQLDSWLEHLERMQKELLRTPVHDTALSDRTASVTSLNREPNTHGWRQHGNPSISRGSSSCGSPSRCESSLGSQESLQTGISSFQERKGNWERAHIAQTPRKEQVQLSHLAPVKIGWLPIQRKVMMVADAGKQNQISDQSLGQVKLRQPITPTFRATNRHQDYPSETAGSLQKSKLSINGDTSLYDKVERSHTSGTSTLGAKTWQTPDPGSPIIKQIPEKRGSTTNEADRPGGWQALRRGWSINRLSTPPAGSQPNEFPTGSSCDTFRKPPLMQTTDIEPHPPLHRTTLAEPSWSLLPGSNSQETHTTLHGTSSIPQVRSQANSSLQPSHIQTTSTATTLVPQNKAGFSSITIASRKVSRSNSTAGAYSHSSNPREPMDQGSRQLTVQRKATIVKVTEQRMVSSPSTEREGTAPSSHALDTVVHRRKATIIKVTEHRESYRPAKELTRHPEYRHSYTEGVCRENRMWGPGNISSMHLDSTSRADAAPVPTTSEKNGNTMHTSTLRLFVSSPPAIAAPSHAPPEVSLRPAGQRLNRPRRPVSCYGSVSEPSKEIATQPAARKWSFGLPQETDINPVNSCSSFIRPGTAEKERGQQVADTLKPNRGEREILPLPEDAARKSSPGVTLIKAPDPHTHQSPEEVLALNAAAIIANIKLQRRLSKKKMPNGSSEKDPIASPLGNTVADEQKYMETNHDENPVGTQAVFVSPSTVPKTPSESISLQEALQRSKPHFISRSQGRVQRLERRAQERRELAHSATTASDVAIRQRGAHHTRPTSHNGNLYKPRDTPPAGKDMHLRAWHTIAGMKKKKEEEKRKEAFQSNRQRLDVFKKKLLDQILQRGNN